MNDSVKTLLGSIGENSRSIELLLKEKNKKINEVQSAMDYKARTKTPLNERQQQSFHEFTGVYAREGGILQQSLMNMERTIRYDFKLHTFLHMENTEMFLLSLKKLCKHQDNAIHSLRRMIDSSENALQMLKCV